MLDQSSCNSGATGIPRASAFRQRSDMSSHATTSTADAANASAATMPERPNPITATRLPCILLRSIITHLSFNVDMPINAKIDAMTQKRITIVGSAQPFFSK